MKPLKITFELDTPIRIPEYPIHFDGVLAYATVQDGLNRGQTVEEAQEALPLQEHEAGEARVWKASWIDFSPGERFSLPIQRTFDLTQTVLDGGRVYHKLRREGWAGEISSSPYKAYLFNEPLRMSNRATAWCVGDADAIASLLDQHVAYLGKLARIGMGRIRSIDIAEDAQAAMLWMRRTLPFDPSIPGYTKVFETCRAPYWRRENRKIAWAPIAMQAAT